MLLTLIDVQDGELSGTAALAVARSLGEPVEAVSFGRVDDAVLAKHGVARVHVLDHPLLADYAAEPYGEALAQLVRALSPTGVLAASTERGNEIMAHLAARTELPLAANCVAVTAGDPWTLTRNRGGGVLLEDAELTAPVKLVTIAPSADGPTADPVDAVEVVTVAPELDGLVYGRIVDRAEAAAGVTLATAKVVVSGGRGVGSAEGFGVLEELAGLVGGAVGCSRVATNNGWRSHSNQVGLTGTKIAPDLYIACGISGATQHWVGCMDAKTILAINTDPDAPMVTRAAYAVIGDVHQILPAVVEEIRRRAG
jgi:electron transfer flavoprotein alpha subunit